MANDIVRMHAHMRADPDFPTDVSIPYCLLYCELRVNGSSNNERELVTLVRTFNFKELLTNLDDQIREIIDYRFGLTSDTPHSLTEVGTLYGRSIAWAQIKVAYGLNRMRDTYEGRPVPVAKKTARGRPPATKKASPQATPKPVEARKKIPRPKLPSYLKTAEGSQLLRTFGLPFNIERQLTQIGLKDIQDVLDVLRNGELAESLGENTFEVTLRHFNNWLETKSA